MNNYFGVFLFVLSATAETYYDSVSEQQLRQGIFKLVEKWKSGNIWSLPLELPSIRPLKLSGMTSQDETGLITMNVSEIIVFGLEDLRLERLSASPDGRISFEFSIPQLLIRSDWYHLMIKPLDLGFLTVEILNDEGTMDVVVGNVSVQADLKFGAGSSGTVITDLDFNFTVRHLLLYLSGSSNPTTTMVRNRLCSRLRNMKFKVWVLKLIKNKAKRHLREYTPKQLFNMISSI